LSQSTLSQYFGMVRCIDDNVGKMLAFLEENNLTEDTIVVFTSHNRTLSVSCKLLFNSALANTGDANIPKEYEILA